MPDGLRNSYYKINTMRGYAGRQSAERKEQLNEQYIQI